MKTKPLPVDTPIERTPWEDLEPQDQLVVLTWIREAMDMRTKEVFRNKAYKAFTSAIAHGFDFGPEVVWDKIHPRMQDHFSHSRAHIDNIEKMIADLEELLEQDGELLEEDEELLEHDHEEEENYGQE